MTTKTSTTKSTTKVVPRPEQKAATKKAPAKAPATKKAPAKPKATKTEAPKPEVVDYSKMTKVELLAAAKAERAATKAAQAAGSELPATPALDYMKSMTPEARKAGKPKGERKPRQSALTPEAAARAEAIIREEAANGNRWHQAAKRLNDEKVPTAKGGAKWYYSTITVHAKRLGLI